MKNIVFTLVAVSLLATFCNPVKAQQNMENILNEKQQAMVAIACLEAKGDIPSLAGAINNGLDTGLTVSQVKEALSQLYAYTGFPRSLNALNCLQSVLQERTARVSLTRWARMPTRCRLTMMLSSRVRRCRQN